MFALRVAGRGGGNTVLSVKTRCHPHSVNIGADQSSEHSEGWRAGRRYIHPTSTNAIGSATSAANRFIFENSLIVSCRFSHRIPHGADLASTVVDALSAANRREQRCHSHCGHPCRVLDIVVIEKIVL